MVLLAITACLHSDWSCFINAIKPPICKQVRIRALSIAAKIFGLSDAAAAAIQQAGILKSLEEELSNSNDILAQINALELLAEVCGLRLNSSLAVRHRVLQWLSFVLWSW